MAELSPVPLEKKERKPATNWYVAGRWVEHCPREVAATAAGAAGTCWVWVQSGPASFTAYAATALVGGGLAHWMGGEASRKRRQARKVEAMWARACAKLGLYRFSRIGHATKFPDLTNIDISHGNVRADVLLPIGMSFSELQAKEAEIGSVFNRGKALQLHIVGDDNHRQARLSIVRSVAFDRYSTEPWPYQPGAGIGIRQDYRQMLLVVGPDGPNILVAGIKGSGKSSWVNAIVAEALLQDMELWGIDLKQVELTPWGPRFRRLALDPLDATLLLRDLRAEIVRRTAYLSSRGTRKWFPGCGLPLLMLVVDELRQVVVSWDGETNDEPKERAQLLSTINALGRAVGIQTVMATQNPRAQFVGEVRENCDVTICCRVRTNTDAFTALGDVGRDLHPELITKAETGVAWVVGDDRPFKARARWVSDKQVTALAAANIVEV